MNGDEVTTRRMAARIEDVIGLSDELLARLGSVYPVPVELADDAAAVRAGLDVLKPRLVRFRARLGTLPRTGGRPPTKAA